jgi:ABC-type dipeptide/oligopeptide/nickel transport system ATPase component
VPQGRRDDPSSNGPGLAGRPGARRGADALRAVDGVSLGIATGETVCLVGESGCGKTVTALSIARLVPAPPANYVGGEILLNGRDVLKMSNDELRDIRGGVVSYVFQEPGLFSFVGEFAGLTFAPTWV